MFYELRFVYLITQDEYTDMRKKNPDWEEDWIDVFELAYTIFFFGIGLNSEKHYHPFSSEDEEKLFKRVKKILDPIQVDYLSYRKKHPDELYYTYMPPDTVEANEKTIEFFYFPFDGHLNHLGHYYRHLFQTSTFVTEQKFLDENELYPYFKTLRAQLSDFEQLLLYYNALVWFGDEWKTIFVTHRLIKNLPLKLADFYITPEQHFKKEIAEAEAKGKPMFAGKRTSYLPV